MPSISMHAAEYNRLTQMINLLEEKLYDLQQEELDHISAGLVREESDGGIFGSSGIPMTEYVYASKMMDEREKMALALSMNNPNEVLTSRNNALGYMFRTGAINDPRVNKAVMWDGLYRQDMQQRLQMKLARWRRFKEKEHQAKSKKLEMKRTKLQTMMALLQKRQEAEKKALTDAIEKTNFGYSLK